MGRPRRTASQSLRRLGNGVDGTPPSGQIRKRSGRGQQVSGAAMDEAELKARLNTLAQEHRDLDAAIDALARSATADMLQIARLKKRKLRLKDEMSLIQDLLIPDIIA
jgi:hypothetical protein